MTTFDGAGGRLPASGTYKMAALCDERSPDWFKVVVEVSECRDDAVPAAAAIFVFFREAFITVNGNMEVWVSRGRLKTGIKLGIWVGSISSSSRCPAMTPSWCFMGQSGICPPISFGVSQVNGLFTRPPAAVSDAISLSAAGGNVTVSHAAGVAVLFGPAGEVTVTVGASLTNQLCAPCGNFNGDAGDDLKLPDGRAARDVAEVVDAWKAKDFMGW